MGPLEDFIIMCLFVSIIVPALLIIVLSLYRFKGYLGYNMLKLAFHRLPNTSTCTICLESTKDGGLTAAYRLPCSHWFHKTCLSKWLGHNNNCPNCRRTVDYWNGMRIEPVEHVYLDFLSDEDFDDDIPIRPRTLWPNSRLPLSSHLRRVEYY